MPRFSSSSRCSCSPPSRASGASCCSTTFAGHFGPNIDQLFQMHGHLWVARPIHSPDFGYVEWSFNWITMYLIHHFAEIEADDLALWIADAIAHIRPEHVQGFAVDAHFFVPGRAYRPYVYD